MHGLRLTRTGVDDEDLHADAWRCVGGQWLVTMASEDAKRLHEQVRNTARRWREIVYPDPGEHMLRPRGEARNEIEASDDWRDLLLWVEIRLYQLNKLALDGTFKLDWTDMIGVVGSDLGLTHVCDDGVEAVLYCPAAVICSHAGRPARMWWQTES